MFIIWRGCGILAPVIAGATLVASVFISKSVLVMGGGMLLGALAIWFIGVFFEKHAERNAKQLVDPKTNQPVLLKKSHDCFFIPLKWCSIPVALFAFFLIWIGATEKSSDTPVSTQTTSKVR